MKHFYLLVYIVVFLPFSIILRCYRGAVSMLNGDDGSRRTWWIESKAGPRREEALVEYRVTANKRRSKAAIENISGDVEPDNYAIW